MQRLLTSPNLCVWTHTDMLGVELGGALKNMDGVAEGVSTPEVAWELAHEMGLEMPITEKIYQVLYGRLSPKRPSLNKWGPR